MNENIKRTVKYEKSETFARNIRKISRKKEEENANFKDSWRNIVAAIYY